MKAAPKVMSPDLWQWPMTSEEDVVGIAVEAEPSHKYSAMFCCCLIDGSRGAI